MSAFTDMFGRAVRRQQADGGELRLGAGVVGHTTRVALCSVVIIGVLALILERNTAVAINGIVAVVVVTAYYLHGTWKFADKHPDAAALAGSSWPKAEVKTQPVESEPVTAPSQINSDATVPPTQHR